MKQSNSIGASSVSALPMQSVMSDADNAISSLSLRLDILEGRLHPVLSPAQDGPAGTENCKRLEKSPLVSAVEGYVDRINAIESRVGDLLSRLEV